MKILLASSSSGGHIFPCITFGRFLEKKGYEVQYIGIKNQFETKYYPKDALYLNIKKSFKTNFNNIVNLINLFKEKKRMKIIIESFDVIVCFGGFITFYISFFFNIKHLFLHEQNIIEGDSIRVSKYKAKRIFYSIERGLQNNEILTGNPTTSLYSTRLFSTKRIKKVLFVFGSLGSETLSNVVINLSNHDDVEFVLVSKKIKIKKDNIKIIDFIKLEDSINDFDLIFSRAGATTLLEFIKNRANVILIPSPYVKNNHQMKNAKYFQNKNMIDIVEEKQFSEEIIFKYIDLYNDINYRKEKYIAKAKYEFLNANELMLKEILNCVD